MSVKTAVCRLCLAMDAPMRIIVNSPLQNVYEKLTNISLNLVHRPVMACYICYSQLRKCHNLMVRAVKADKVLTQVLQSDEIVIEELFAMLNQKAYQHALYITPVELITITGTENDLVKEEIKEEPLLLSPYNEGMETDESANEECLTAKESENEDDMERELLKDEDIESQRLMIDRPDIKQEELDPLNISFPGEYIDIRETTNGEEIKSEDAEDRARKQSAGDAPAEKCKQSPAEKIRDGSTLTPDEKNILEKPKTRSTVVEKATSSNISTYTLRSTKTANKNQVSINTSMYSDTPVNSDTDCSSTITDSGSHRYQNYLGTFVCDDCGNTFDDKCLLIKHIEHHITNKQTSSRESSHQRPVRTQGVSDKRTETHSGKKLFKCEICKVRFARKAGLNEHLKCHTGVKLYECEICKVTFRQKGRLVIHSRIHTGEKPYECDICSIRFNQKCYLKSHLGIHTGEKPYECEVCKVRFRKKNNLNNHSRVHTGEKPYECEICKFRFSEKGNLRKHLKIHTGETLYECKICKVRFRRNGSLKSHLKVHTGEKPYECEICKVRFSEKSNLNRHLRVHTGENKAYECKVCKVRFNQASNLKTHFRIHIDEKLFECEICNFRFKQKHSLKTHLRIHTKEKSCE